ncbi:precorrin-3B synthase [Microbispora triticiradicis]|uniref:Precorrin-3B synthase n=2 Tax=Microbispora TaxID=2005 RepID=A0ABY3M2K7_9ACTN|nr:MULTISPECIES: precorrin-3B synthase [Microbispora]TLP57783.1 precorrin-3B synthase [Microbispora fusca]TYB64621.1 precorrin-3B synthase [Microbispora tritici]
MGGFSGRAAQDACPGALQVHAAADGALARVRVPGGGLAAGALRELAACARELGAGVVELTSRANVQVRGLADPPAFAARMAAAGLLPSATHERVRNIVASPLSGRSATAVLDVRPLVADLDAALCGRAALAHLPGRFLFALDDGTGDVLGLGADVTLAAHPDSQPVSQPGGGLTLLLAGEPVGSVTAGDAVSVALAAAEEFQEVRGDAWRVAELPGGPATIAARLPGRLAVLPPVPVTPATPRRGGPSAQVDGRVALDVIVPLGRLTAGQAGLLADLAAGEVRLTPWRTVVLPDLAPEAVGPVTEALAGAGLVIDPASPYARLSACTGRPGCAKALADVQADAVRWAESGVPEPPGLRRPGAEPLDAGLIHWAGCERRCGRPRGRVTDVVATTGGYDVRR